MPGRQRPDGPYGLEMTAGPAWPALDEMALWDGADDWERDRKAVDTKLDVFGCARTRLFKGAAALWSGQAADAANAKHGVVVAALQTEERRAAAVVKLKRDTADIVANTKREIIANTEMAQEWIEKITNHPQSTGEQKTAFIQALVKRTHGENVALVEAGTYKLGPPPAAPLTVRPADFTGGDAPLAPPPKEPSQLPDDPKQLHDAWERLSQQEKDLAYARDHSIGNRAGMPFVDRDHYNRTHLGELQKANQADLDRLRAQHPNWAAGTKPLLMTQAYENWKKQWDAADHAHDGYAQVQNALNSPDRMPRLLGTIDDKGHAAVSINDPDAAKRTATFVPGTGQDLAGFDASAEKSLRMYEAAREANAALKPSDVSVTTWMGYDRPMNVFEAAHTSYAHNGAAALDDFQAGLRASHNDALAGGPSLNTVIGHSYGSTKVGAAALGGHHLDANNVIAVGSPGVLAGHAGDLSLDPGAHVFATRAENDVIGNATYYSLGPDPMSARFGGIPFEAAPGPANPLGLPSIAAHSSYWYPHNPALDNMGKIIAGRTDVTPPTFTP